MTDATRFADFPREHPGRRVLSGRTPTFSSIVDPRCSYSLFVPEDVRDDEVPLSLWVFVHGTGRQFEVYLDTYAELARQHRAVVMTPLFPAGVPAPDDVYNYQAIEHGGTRFDQVLLGMIDEVAHRWNVDASTFFLHGFSGGGQFALRFAMLHPDRLSALSVGAPGQVTRLSGDWAWPHGLAGLEETFGTAFDAATFAALPAQVLAGSLDDDPRDIALPGPHGTPVGRLTQARALAESMREIGTATRFDLVEGVGHDGAAVIPAVTDFLRERLAR